MGSFPFRNCQPLPRPSISGLEHTSPFPGDRSCRLIRELGRLRKAPRYVWEPSWLILYIYTYIHITYIYNDNDIILVMYNHIHIIITIIIMISVFYGLNQQLWNHSPDWVQIPSTVHCAGTPEFPKPTPFLCTTYMTLQFPSIGLHCATLHILHILQCTASLLINHHCPS